MTGASVAVALLVGGMELLGLVGGRPDIGSGFWRLARAAENHSTWIGYVIVAAIAVCWLLSAVLYRFRAVSSLEIVRTGS